MILKNVKCSVTGMITVSDFPSQNLTNNDILHILTKTKNPKDINRLFTKKKAAIIAANNLNRMGKQNKNSESEVLDKLNINQLKNEIRDLQKKILELTKINEKLRNKNNINDEETMETTSNSENPQLDPEIVEDTEDGSWQTVLKRKNKRYKVSRNETIINKINQTDKIKEKDNNTPITTNQKETKTRRPFKPPPINIFV
ncbi:Protein of unknown function [Cotesia congregata]|uniref:Uncharacterized protein n=1 Tax=Cotesia congregata TaxID=51543 RepID=A0A8J2EDP2_COTCN|nr:Protein of unknown function [Cotesia congregata]